MLALFEYDENTSNNCIKLKLNKPNTWNWELSASKSSSNIALPNIQLFNNDGILLAETHDRNSYNNYEIYGSKASDSVEISSCLQNDLSKIIENILNKNIQCDENISTNEVNSRSSKSDFNYSSSNNSKQRTITTNELPNRQKKINYREKSRQLSTKSEENNNLIQKYLNLKKCNSTTDVHLERRKLYKRSSSQKDSSHTSTDDIEKPKYILRTCNAGTLVIPEENKSIRRSRRRHRNNEKLNENWNYSYKINMRNSNEHANNPSHHQNILTNFSMKDSNSLEKTEPRLRIENSISTKMLKKSVSATNVQCPLPINDDCNEKNQYKPILKSKSYGQLTFIGPKNLKRLNLEETLLNENTALLQNCNLGEPEKRLNFANQEIENASFEITLQNGVNEFQTFSEQCKELFPTECITLDSSTLPSVDEECNSIIMKPENSSSKDVEMNLKQLNGRTKDRCKQKIKNNLLLESNYKNNIDANYQETTKTNCEDNHNGIIENIANIQNNDYSILSSDLTNFNIDNNRDRNNNGQAFLYSFINEDCIFEVIILKGPRGLGFSVMGGIDTNLAFSELIRIKCLFPHGAAWSTGKLKPGDIILEVNSVSLLGLTNYEALEILRNISSNVKLRICRPVDKYYENFSQSRYLSKSVQEIYPKQKCCKNTDFIKQSNSFPIENSRKEFEILMVKQQGSLGFTLQRNSLGHFVKDLVKNPAATDGRIKAGDKIIAVNDVLISELSHEEAVTFLRKSKNSVKLRLNREVSNFDGKTSPTNSDGSNNKRLGLRSEAINYLNNLANKKQSMSENSSESSNISPARRLRRGTKTHLSTKI